MDIFLTANNHILDKGREGIERTLGIYSRMEKEGRVRHTGAAVSAMDDSLRFPLKVVSKGIRLAFINFTYGTNCGIKEAFPKVHRIDTVEIAGAIQRAKESGADFIVALPHWGAEYVLRHSASQERLARWLAGKGCDAVIGAHPHVLQDTTTMIVQNGKSMRQVPVVYSLGNFISNMGAISSSDQGGFGYGRDYPNQHLLDMYGPKDKRHPEMWENGNPKKFNVYATNNPSPDGSNDGWTLLKTFTSVKPSGYDSGQYGDGLVHKIKVDHGVQTVETGQKDRDTDDVEVEVDHGGTAGILICAHRRNQRGDTGADILTHDDGDSAAVGDDTGSAQRLQDADAGAGTLDDAGDQCAHQNAEDGIGEADEEVGEPCLTLQGLDGIGHGSHAGHQDGEADEDGADALFLLILAHIEQDADEGENAG